MCVCVCFVVCVFVCVCCCSCLLLAACCCVALGSTFVVAIFSLYGDAFVVMGWGTTRVEHFSLNCCCLFFYCFIVFFNFVLFVLFCFASSCLFYVLCFLCVIFFNIWLSACIHSLQYRHACIVCITTCMACMHIASPIPIDGSTFYWGSGNALHAWYAYILPLICLIGCFYSVYVWLSWFIMMSSVAVVVLVRAVDALVVVDVLAWDNWAELLS